VSTRIICFFEKASSRDNRFPVAADFGAFQSAINAGMVGAWGETQSVVEATVLTRPVTRSYLRCAVTVNRDVAPDDADLFYRDLAGAVNSTNTGPWVYSLLPFTNTPTRSPVRSIARNASRSVAMNPPPAAVPPLSAARTAVTGARVVSANARRNGQTPEAADAADPPAAPLPINLANSMPIAILVSVALIVAGVIVWKVVE
jgi:hypothetical protein